MEQIRVLVFVFSFAVGIFGCVNAFSQTPMNTFDHNATAAVASTNASSFTFARDALPIFLAKCFSCHNDQTRFLPNWSDYKTAFAHREEINAESGTVGKGNTSRSPCPPGIVRNASR